MIAMHPTPPWLQSILEEHFEEIQMLWELRRTAIRDPSYKSTDVGDMDERIAANVDALLINRDHSEEILLAGLDSGDPSAVFAACFVFLLGGDEKLIDRMVALLCIAEDEVIIKAIAEALTVSPLKANERMMRNLLTHSRPEVASVAAEALAFHAKLDSTFTRLDDFLVDRSPDIRRRGWSIVSCLCN